MQRSGALGVMIVSEREQLEKTLRWAQNDLDSAPGMCSQCPLLDGFRDLTEAIPS